MHKHCINKNQCTVFQKVHKSDEIPVDLVTSDITEETENYDGFGEIYLFGEGRKSFGSSASEHLQNYNKLLQYHQQNHSLFVDETFPTENIKLPRPKGKVVWKRPPEITKNPVFILDGASRFDIQQGELGDCWFLAALGNLTLNKKLFNFVVPNDQSFSDNYAGIFHFRFWEYGRWVDIVIDDKLPTIDNKLVYLRPSDPREFWPSLLEKAYAKFYGSYKNIIGGQISEALEDVSGGLSEYYNVNDPNLFEIMYMSFERLSFIGCGIESKERELALSNGLVSSHAYSITSIKKINLNGIDINLLRIRNPWGNSVEWNGKWSDHDSDSWNSLPTDLRKELFCKGSDGEFWMEFSDFQKNFTFVDICHLNPSSAFQLENLKQWHVKMFEGSWVQNVTAGGGYKYRKTFHNNPQYHLTIKGNNSADDCYAVVFGLMQKDRRKNGQNTLPLELNVFSIKSPKGHSLDAAFFETVQPVVHEEVISVRQLTVRVLLPVGRYCVIPSTSDPNVEGNYLFRIYAERRTDAIDNDDDVEYSNDAILNRNESTQNTKKSIQIAQNNRVNYGWSEIRKSLNDHFGKKRLFCFMKPKISFSEDTCKHIVSLWDRDFSGKLEYHEFIQLMQDVSNLKKIFKMFDTDNSGKLDGFELKNLLKACGYKVDRQILIIIMLRYGSKGSISFENFVTCAFKLKTMIDEYNRRKAMQNSEQLNVSRKNWLQTALYV